jgi:hypothetical protein
MKRIFLALAAAAGLLGTVPALGQTLLVDLSLKVPLAAAMDNPCSAQVEAILLQGTADVQQRVWQMPDGKLRLQIMEQTALQGTDSAVLLGAVSPTYSVSAGSIYDVEFVPDSITIWDYKKVGNSAGALDNFHSVLAIDFDPGSLKVNLSLAPACDNGLPQ